MSHKKSTGHSSGNSTNPAQTPEYIMDEVKLLLADVTTPESAVEFDSQPKTVSATQRATPATIRNVINPPLWTWADLAARNAQQVTPDDLGKIGYQKNTNTYYQLNGVVPTVWEQLPDPADTSAPFDLSTGAADAPSYHDFFSLQIAFEDVWAELLDTRIEQVGTELYAYFDALMDRSRYGWEQSGITDRGKGFSDAPSDDIAGVDQLNDFLANLRTVLGIPSGSDAPSQIPAEVGQLKDAVLKTLKGCDMLVEELYRTGTWHSVADHHPLPDTWLVETDANNDSHDAYNHLSDFPGTPRSDIFNGIARGLAPLSPQSTDVTFPDITKLLKELDAMLKERYRFDVFAPASINYGLLLNYRQHWVPQSYQVGDLVTTIPLAPQETRRYTTKSVVKKTRNLKEIEDFLHTGKHESANTWRVDAEIVDRAKSQTNFHANAKGSYGTGELYKIEGGMDSGNDQGMESAQTKREFHEMVFKAAQEHRNEHRIEITTEESREDESTSYREIRNPNDELTVTYLFYELQRRYLVDEHLYKVTPVVLVANDVPAPHEVDSAWILRHDWIIKRAILDDSFLPALEYLSANYTGEEVTLQTLELAVSHQKSVVDKISQQVQLANRSLDSASTLLQAAEDQSVQGQANAATQKEIKAFFDPLGIGQAGAPPDGNSDRARVEFARDTLNRAQEKVNQLVSELKTETTALQVAIDKYTAAATKHYGMLAEIDRLRIHVKDNIIHYMQAIWSYEPPDQRYFRIYDLDVPMFDHHSKLNTYPKPGLETALEPGRPKYTIPFSPPTPSPQPSKLHQIANLDNLLGFKGNYMMFPLVNFHNYMAWYLVHPYISFDGNSVTAADPDPDADLTISQLKEGMSNIYAKHQDTFAANEAYFEETMLRLLSKQDPEMVVVPSNSLYIEALPGTHPLLEDFKLMHRAIDVKKAQAELRKAELENLRLAARLANAEYGDPDIDKVVVVSGEKNVTVDAGQ